MFEWFIDWMNEQYPVGVYCPTAVNEVYSEWALKMIWEE